MKYLWIIFLLHIGSCYAADINKCVASDGSVSYSDQACKTTAKQTTLVKHKPNAVHDIKNSLVKSMPWKVQDYFYQSIFGVYLCMSLVCYMAYCRDKVFAVTGQRRTPESRLHTFELLGGWPGGLIAQQTLRHKNRKVSYQLVFWAIVSLHMLAWLDYLALNQYLLKTLKHYFGLAA